MNLNSPSIKPGLITEAEFNSLIYEPWVVPHMDTSEGFSRVDTRDLPSENVFDTAYGRVRKVLLFAAVLIVSITAVVYLLARP